MTAEFRDVWFSLPPDAEAALSSEPILDLVQGPVRAEAPVRFRLLDTFDTAIATQDTVLIETGGRLELWESAGPALSQDAGRAGNFVADLCDGPVKQALGFVDRLRCLMPQAEGDLHDRTIAYYDDEAKTHVRLHLRALCVGEDRQLLLGRVVGLRGYDKARDRLQAHLVAVGGVALHAVDAYRKLVTDFAPYDPKPTVAITTDERAFDAATEIIAAHLPVARRNEPGILADSDTECLHDYRVALRKIRSVLSLFKGVYIEAQTAELKQRFSVLMAPTGRLRDLDVYLLERQTY